MKSSPSDDSFLGCVLLAFLCALAFVAGVLAWNAFVLPPSGFAP